ncbi:MAG: sigma-70 family RNA polymerase sigma factor [Ruminococcus sp.]|nr:sigma-70 family RNA polymerase sigma factor [Ruminococcus sp.]
MLQYIQTSVKEWWDIMEDGEIIGLYFERSETVLTETSAKYGGIIRACIKNILADREDAAECENDTYMGAWTSIPPACPENLRAYLLKIARNAAINRYRKLTAQKRGRNACVSFEELAGCICCDDETRRYETNELRELINGFLETLNPEMRRVFLLRYWYCASVKETAACCGMSISKTESMLFRARNKMKKFLSERGVEV